MNALPGRGAGYSGVGARKDITPWKLRSSVAERGVMVSVAGPGPTASSCAGAYWAKQAG